MPDGESQGRSSFRPNTSPAPASDIIFTRLVMVEQISLQLAFKNLLIDVLFLMSAGKLFHNFWPWNKNALSKLVEWDLGTCSKARVVDLVCLSRWSMAYVSNKETYSGACPEMLLNTVRQVWYWTRFWNGSQFSFRRCHEIGFQNDPCSSFLQLYRSCQVSICITQRSIIWATSWQNQQNGMCAQRRLRSAWASA